MAGDLAIARLAFQQSSNSVAAQLTEARLELAATTDSSAGKAAIAPALDPAGTAASSAASKPLPSLMVKILDRRA